MAKFRYWNSALLEFIMFDNGFYSYTKSSGFNMAEPEAEFNWEKAEQEFTRDGVSFFIGDITELDDNLHGIVAMKNGILGFNTYDYYCEGIEFDFEPIEYYLLDKTFFSGNIHQNKELM